MSRIRVAAAQICSTADVELNFKLIRHYLHEAQSRECNFLALPECFAFIGRGPTEAVAAAQPLTGTLFQRYCDLCRDFGIAVSFGGFHTRNDLGEDKRIENTHVLVNAQGKIVTTYVKTHLFDVDTVDGSFRESSFSRPGQRLVLVKNSPLKNLALTTCYDVRFPLIYDAYRTTGAHTHLVPSAFMPSTGAAHWEVLLRARAIETQCFVIAAAQCGAHNEVRKSYGHTMIIDPWGKVLVELDGVTPGLAVADLDFAELSKVRQKMPVHTHRRIDLFHKKCEHSIVEDVEVVDYEGVS